MNRIFAGFLAIFVVCYAGFCFGTDKAASESQSLSVRSQANDYRSYKKTFGPFDIGKNHIVVVNSIKGEASGRALNSFEIKNETGSSFYKKTYKNDPEGSTDLEGAFKLEGKSGEGIILYFDTEPSAPPAGKSFQIFGMEKGRMKPVSDPIDVYGSLEQLLRGKSEKAEKLFDDVIKVDTWTGLIGIKIPLMVDFEKLTITPLIKKGIFDIYFLTLPHQPVALPDFFYKDHNIKAQVEKISEAEGMNVEFLNAFAEVQLKKQKWGHELYIDISNLWLKVKINGREGWVYDPNDFNMLGLPPID